MVFRLEWRLYLGSIAVMTAVLLGACSSDRKSGTEPARPDGLLIDAPIILAHSDALEPLPDNPNDDLLAGPPRELRVPGDGYNGHFAFDLGASPLYATGLANDLIISNHGICSEPLSIWNETEQKWQALAYRIFQCHEGWGTGPHRSLLSVSGLDIADVVDSAGHFYLKSRYFSAYPEVWAVQVHPEFDVLPDSPENVYGRWALTCDGKSYYYAAMAVLPNGYAAAGIYKVAGDNPPELIFHRTEWDWAYGVAFDGRYLWTFFSSDNAPDSIYQVTVEGLVRCAFTAPEGGAKRMTSDGTNLWVAAYTEAGAILKRIDLAQSCAAGKAVVTDSIPFPGPVRGLAWDGANLLIANDSLYRVTPEGETTDRYAISVADVQGIAWDGAHLHVLSRGPLTPDGEWLNEMPITRFTLPR